jgi:NAD(P)-dependent dehydrogenase (short-subunit alcohol dehydrogenase family)
MSFAEKVAIVTGASSGIGRATAVSLAREGAGVVGVARSAERLSDVVAALESPGAGHLAVAADVTAPDAAGRIVGAAMERFGRIDVLVNAAGVFASGTVETTSDDDWDRMFAVNLRAAFRLMREALPHLSASRGAVVNVSSVTGLRSFAGILAYAVSKAGVDQLTRGARAGAAWRAGERRMSGRRGHGPAPGGRHGRTDVRRVSRARGGHAPAGPGRAGRGGGGSRAVPGVGAIRLDHRGDDRH